MVQGMPVFRLPLMHHLVQQRVARGIPAISPDMAPGEDDLDRGAASRRSQLAESAPHPIGNADRDRAEHTGEVARVEELVHQGQAIDQRLISGGDRPRRAGTLRT